jgi:hypothetical protein
MCLLMCVSADSCRCSRVSVGAWVVGCGCVCMHVYVSADVWMCGYMCLCVRVCEIAGARNMRVGQ